MTASVKHTNENRPNKKNVMRLLRHDARIKSQNVTFSDENLPDGKRDYGTSPTVYWKIERGTIHNHEFLFL